MGGQRKNKQKTKPKSKAQAKRAERARRRDPVLSAAEKNLNGIRSDLAEMQLADQDPRRRRRDRDGFAADLELFQQQQGMRSSRQNSGYTGGRGTSLGRGRGRSGGQGGSSHGKQQPQQRGTPTGFQAAYPNFQFHAGLGFKARHSHLYDMLEVDFGSASQSPAPSQVSSSTAKRAGGGGSRGGKFGQQSPRNLHLTPELKQIARTSPIFPNEVVFTGPSYILDQFHIRFIKGPTLGGGIPEDEPLSTLPELDTRSPNSDNVALKKAEEAEDWALRMLLGPESETIDGGGTSSQSDTDDDMNGESGEDQEEDAEMEDGFAVNLDQELTFSREGSTCATESDGDERECGAEQDDDSDVMSLTSDHGRYQLDSDSDSDSEDVQGRMDVDPPSTNQDDQPSSSSDLDDLFTIDTTPMSQAQVLLAASSSSSARPTPHILGSKPVTWPKAPRPELSAAQAISSIVADLREYQLDDYDNEPLHPNLVAAGHDRGGRRNRSSGQQRQPRQPCGAEQVNMQSGEDMLMAKYAAKALLGPGYVSSGSDKSDGEETGSDMESENDSVDSDGSSVSDSESDTYGKDDDDGGDSDSSCDNSFEHSDNEVMLNSMATGENRAMLQFMLMQSDDDSETEALVRDYIDNVGRARSHDTDDSDTGGVFGNAHVLKWAQQRTGAGLLDNGDFEHDPFMFPKPGMRRIKSGGKNKREKGANRKDKADPYGFGEKVYVGKSNKKGEKRRKGQLFTTVDIGEVHEIIQQFMADPFEQTQLPPMAKLQRKIVNSISKCYQLKSKALGSGHTRRVELIKTKHSISPTGDRRRKLDALLRSHAYTPVTESWGGTGSNKGKGKDKVGTGAGPPPPRKVLPGYVVGKHAPPLNEENVGHKLLQVLGWSPGSGIGKSIGIQVPIVAVVRGRNRGLGAES